MSGMRRSVIGKLWKQPREKAGDTGEMEKPEMIGGDKDEHGCIASAGYTWSEVQKDCIRLWEKGVRLTSVKDERNTLYIVFSPDSSRVELFFSEEDIPNEILDRRSLPSGGYVWNMEDDDTKNVRLEMINGPSAGVESLSTSRLPINDLF